MMIFLFLLLSECVSLQRMLAPSVRDIEPRLATRGESVSVIGSRFADTPQLQCRMSHKADTTSPTTFAGTYISPSRVECRIPNDIAFALYDVSVANDGSLFVSSPVKLNIVADVADAADKMASNSLAVEPDLTLAGWSPLRACPRSFLTLRVRLSTHQLRAASIRCRFGDIVVPAFDVLNAHEFRCQIPAQSSATIARASKLGVPLTVTLAASVNSGTDWSTHRSLFIYDNCDVDDAGGDKKKQQQQQQEKQLAPPPRLDSFYPLDGAPGVLVTAYGDRFSTVQKKHHRPLCRFDKTVVAANVVSATQLTCAVPRHSGGLYSFQVSNDGIKWSEGGKFRIEAAAVAPIVTEIHPAHGLAGTLVSVFGDEFEDSEYLMCRFSGSHRTDAVVRASFVLMTSVQCEVPLLKAGETYVLQVSNNGESWSELRATPLKFTVESGTTQANDPLHVEDIFDDGAPPDVAIVHARALSLAPRKGPSGTSVVLTGTDFDSRRHYRCRFGSAVVSAVYISPQRIECDAPLRAFPGPVFVTVVDNDDGVFGDSTQLSFEYLRGLAVPRLYAVSPTTASIGSNVTVYGRRFVASGNLCCMFGLFRSPATLVRTSATVPQDPQEQLQKAEQRTSIALQCEVPKQLRSGESVELRIANNGCIELARGSSTDDDEHQRVISNDLRTLIIAHSVPLINSVEPRVPSRGALIVLEGRGFEAGDDAACRFGDSLKSHMRYISDTSATCAVPHELSVPANADRANPLAAFPVLLTATNDGISWSVTPFSMRVRVHGILPVIKTIWPPVGTVGTVVTVTGDHMVALDDSLVRCRFGKAIVLPASIEGAALHGIDCVAPARSAAFGSVESEEALQHPLTVELSLSFDGGREWASAPQSLFTFASEHGSWSHALTLVVSVLLAMFGVPALFIAIVLRAQRKRSPWLTKLLQQIAMRTSKQKK